MLSAVWSTRRRRISALIAAVAVIALGLPLVPGIGASARADSSAVTVAGDWHRWIPVPYATDAPYGQEDDNSTPTVTVNQTQNIVDQIVHVSWTNFTPSNSDPNYGVAEDGLPYNPVLFDANQTFYPVIILECAGGNRSAEINPFADEQSNCYNSPINLPGAGQHGTSNLIGAVTQRDGTGSADFHVETGLTNNFLGCDDTRPCSVVVMPVAGGGSTHDNETDYDACDEHYNDSAQGDYNQNIPYSATYTGATSPTPGATAPQCDWDRRISIPLSFAPLARGCPSNSNSFSAVGSPMLTTGIQQYQTGWCRGTNAVSFAYDSTVDEYQARSQFLSNSAGGFGDAADVALVSRPPDASAASVRKFTYAPISVNAVSIGYYVDNVKTGVPISDLRLDARLMAKLLTQSYATTTWSCRGADDATKPGPYCAPEVKGNPDTIIADPEFQALNMGPDHPDHPDASYFALPGNVPDAFGAFYPSVVGGNSDQTYELTRWIASDPDAAAFLAGKPDPWGMRVNPYYNVNATGEKYPLDRFEANDPGWNPPPGGLQGGFQNTWNPISPYQQVAQRLIGSGTSASSESGFCPDNAQDATCGPSLPKVSVHFPGLPGSFAGQRDLWAVVDNAAAAAYNFPTAALVSPQFSSNGVLLNAGTPVTPTTTTMSAAVSDMKTNPDGITQYVDHTIKDQNAYPLTVVDYAMVPTCGLTPKKAAGISSMLNHVVSSQSYGVQPGTIAPGLLGLDTKQVSQVNAAANAVSTQSCTSAPLDPNIKPNVPGGPSGGKTTFGSGSNGDGGGSLPPAASAPTGANVPSSNGAVGPLSAGPSASPSATPSASASPADAGFKPAGAAGTMSWVVPVMLLVGAVFLIGAPLTWFLTATTAGRSAIGRMRNLR